MKFIKDPKTGIEYSPILPEDFTNVFTIQGYGGTIYKFVEYKPERISYSLLQQKWTEDPRKIKEIHESWLRVTCLWGHYFLDRKSKYRQTLNVVKKSSIQSSKKIDAKEKRRLIEGMDVYYLKEAWDRRLDPETKDVWKDILPNL